VSAALRLLPPLHSLGWLRRERLRLPLLLRPLSGPRMAAGAC